MKQLAESELLTLSGGGGYDGDLPASTPRISDAYMANILAWLAPSRTVHHAD